MTTPPKPDSFNEFGAATTNVRLMLLPTWQTRKMMSPRLLLVHTNAAQHEGHIQSAYNWAVIDGNTKPHYQVDRDGQAARFLPSNRQGSAQFLANLFGISIETADLGTLAGLGGFSSEQGETLAAIIAYEAIYGNYPIEYPTSWDGTGVACHTEPFGYPLWTNVKGKTCPGSQKKYEMREWIMPRANEIKAAWLTPTPIPPDPTPVPPIGDSDMSVLASPIRIYDTRNAGVGGALVGNSPRGVPLGAVPAGMTGCLVNITVTAPVASGYLVAWADGAMPGTSNINFSTGQTICNMAALPISQIGAIQMLANVGCHVIVDLLGWTK